MIRQERGDAVGLADSVVPRMIRRGRSKAVAWLDVSNDRKVRKYLFRGGRSVAPGMIRQEQRDAVELAVSVGEGCRVVFCVLRWGVFCRPWNDLSGAKVTR